MARARVHQHVNPLARYFRELDIEPLDAGDVYDDPSLPILVDIGCARGRFLLEMAREQKGWNYLGLEIREPLVDDANAIRDDEGLGNLHYVFCNAPFDLSKLLKDVPEERIRMVAIQFPDPWFKKKHAKRRMVNSRLVRMIAENLADDGEVFLQTDVEFVAEEMKEVFETSGEFEIEEVDASPLPFKTEREIAVENRDEDVYRFRAKRKEA